MSDKTREDLLKEDIKHNDSTKWFFDLDSKTDESPSNRLVEKLYDEMSADLRDNNLPFPLSSVRSVSIFRDEEGIHVRIRLETTVPEWKENKKAIIERYGSSIDFLEVTNFEIVPR